jgi:hypothetical protein
MTLTWFSRRCSGPHTFPAMNRVIAGALATALSGVGASAQARPDFTGTWVRAVEAAPPVATAGDAGFRMGDMGSGWGTPLTISIQPDSLIIAYVFFGTYDLQPPVRLAYALNGSESQNTIMIGHATTVQRSRIVWRDSALVITTIYPVPREAAATRRTVEVRHMLTLASPTSLVVETTRPGANGTPVTAQTAYSRR